MHTTQGIAHVFPHTLKAQQLATGPQSPGATWALGEELGRSVRLGIVEALELAERLQRTL